MSTRHDVVDKWEAAYWATGSACNFFCENISRKIEMLLNMELHHVKIVNILWMDLKVRFSGIKM